MRLITPQPRLAFALLAASCAFSSADARGQTSAPQQTQPATAEATLADDDPMAVFRAPLLREGTSLVEAVATLGRIGEHDAWTLAVQPANAAMPPYSLTVLPSTRLGEMERIVEAIAADSAEFRITGRIYAFRDRNYILLTHAAVTGPAPGAGPATMADRATSAPAASSPVAAPVSNDDSAEAIARSLEQAAGPIARSSGIARPANSNPAGPATTAATLQENTVLVNRRGKITRDRGGGWLLVLDADATGLADPPMRLLPCMLLESIEEYARRVGNNSPIIVTGQVLSYHGQNYLLPTVYRIPREGSRITP